MLWPMMTPAVSSESSGIAAIAPMARPMRASDTTSGTRPKRSSPAGVRRESARSGYAAAVSIIVSRALARIGIMTLVSTGAMRKTPAMRNITSTYGTTCASIGRMSAGASMWSRQAEQLRRVLDQPCRDPGDQQDRGKDHHGDLGDEGQGLVLDRGH